MKSWKTSFCELSLRNIGLLPIVFCWLLFPFTAHPQGEQNLSPKAKKYLQEFFEIAEQNSLLRDSVNWPEFREFVYSKAVNAQSLKDCYKPIEWGLAYIQDGHSFFLGAERSKEVLGLSTDSLKETTGPIRIPGPSPTGEVKDEIGIIKIPWFISGDRRICQHFADTLQEVVKSLDSHSLKGWIIDLRENGGGYNWPMHAGISALYEEDTVGYYLYPDGHSTPWILKNGVYDQGDPEDGGVSHPYRLKNQYLPIAILLSAETASSGETLVVSFLGSHRVKTFGEATKGATTGNDVFILSDGSHLFLSTCRFADRNGRAYFGPIQPDIPTDDSAEFDSINSLERAVEWVQSLN
ncbi:S41 family peptidase [bacterium SCSIO 12741]|nr:S41 family peptidase [bacterium SCSIO 12741]